MSHTMKSIRSRAQNKIEIVKHRVCENRLFRVPDPKGFRINLPTSKLKPLL